MVLFLQLGVLLLFLGNADAAGHVFLLGLGMLALSPWTWTTLLGLFALTKDD